MDILSHCTLCRRLCGINRYQSTGACGADAQIKIARAALHFWEEPCLSGTNGSGTVFFSHCSLGCVFCQNYDVSTRGVGKVVSEQALADKFLQLQEEGAHNINLVTPTHYVPRIIRALDKAKAQGLTLPIVYNTGTYETEDTIKMLDGYIDIYLPDFKYYSDTYAVKYSNAPHYFETASAAIAQMMRQVGSPRFNADGIMQSGIIVRCLLLPHLLFDMKKIIDYLYATYGDDIYISIMSQYTPLPHVQHIPELSQPVGKDYYNALVDYAAHIGITNAFIQEGDAADESFIPPFNPNDI